MFHHAISLFHPRKFEHIGRGAVFGSGLMFSSVEIFDFDEGFEDGAAELFDAAKGEGGEGVADHVFGDGQGAEIPSVGGQGQHDVSGQPQAQQAMMNMAAVRVKHLLSANEPAHRRQEGVEQRNAQGRQGNGQGRAPAWDLTEPRMDRHARA